MTGAGGTVGATGLTQIEKFSLNQDEKPGNANPTFGPLPAAVQDIGALPSTLDGIRTPKLIWVSSTQIDTPMRLSTGYIGSTRVGKVTQQEQFCYKMNRTIRKVIIACTVTLAA